MNKIIRTEYVIPYNKKYRYVKNYVYQPPMFIYYALKKISRVFTKCHDGIEILIEKNTVIVNKRVKKHDYINE